MWQAGGAAVTHAPHSLVNKWFLYSESWGLCSNKGGSFILNRFNPSLRVKPESTGKAHSSEPSVPAASVNKDFQRHLFDADVRNVQQLVSSHGHSPDISPEQDALHREQAQVLDLHTRENRIRTSLWANICKHAHSLFHSRNRRGWRCESCCLIGPRTKRRRSQLWLQNEEGRGLCPEKEESRHTWTLLNAQMQLFKLSNHKKLKSFSHLVKRSSVWYFRGRKMSLVLSSG